MSYFLNFYARGIDKYGVLCCRMVVSGKKWYILGKV